MGKIPIASLYTMSSSQELKGPCIGSMVQANVGDWAETCRWSNSVAQSPFGIYLLPCSVFSRYLPFGRRSGKMEGDGFEAAGFECVTNWC